MTTATSERPPVIDRAVWQELAEDLETLARLHDREPDRTLVDELRQSPIAEWFALPLGDSGGAAVFDHALGELPRPVDRESLDTLATDYADIYLVHGLHASPAESPWLDPDHLVCQEPMFQVREWYAHYGLEATDWRQRSDDHLVVQLRFMAHLARTATDYSLVDLARFLDRHALRWIPDFAERVAARCRTPFFAGLAVLTSDYLEQLRDLVEAITGLEREVVEIKPDSQPAAAPAPQPYMPGVGPGW
ncbi:MAG: molecular chaperone TorD family protein [Geminicoccaceae bacterium]|nr:molecular chaperone TorD family protein [Geminicoccaceae bacterium]